MLKAICIARNFVLGVALAATMAAGALAQAAPATMEQVTADLSAAQLSAARQVLEARLAEAPADDQARFALGAVQFLAAIEHLGQGLHRYGLRTRVDAMPIIPLIPALQLPIPENPHPEVLTYDKFRGLLEAFVGELDAADATLGGIRDDAVTLPLDLARIRLDFVGDGAPASAQPLLQVAAAFGLRLPSGQTALEVEFDWGDVAWFQGYTHLLRAIADFPLAYDWHETFELVFPAIFNMPDSAYAALQASAERARQELDKLGPAPGYPNFKDDEAVKKWRDDYNKRLPYQQILDYGRIADLVAFIHLMHWPVAAPERLVQVQTHLEAMVAASRESWTRIRAETDDQREWIPNPGQHSALGRVSVTESQIKGWLSFLDEFEALLEGRRLLPHPRFAQGFDLDRFFREPRTFDPVLLAQGSAALPYLRDGEITSGNSWRTIGMLMGGNFLSYVLWFN